MTEFLEAKRELNEIFTPLCVEAAHISDPSVITREQPELLDQVHRLVEPLTIANGTVNQASRQMLPWDLFLGHEIYPASGRSIESGNAILRDFVKRHPEIKDQDEETLEYVKLTWQAFEQIYLDGVHPINEAEWRHNEQFMLGLDPAIQTDVGKMNQFRLTGINKNEGWVYDPQTPMRRSDELLFVRNPLGGESFGEKDIILPVGEYGPEFTETLLKTVVIMQDRIRTIMPDSSEQATVGHEAVLGQFTARANPQSSPEISGVSGETTLATLHEGILTIAQALAQLTAEKVDGYDDPYVLMDDIVASGLVELLAARVTLGLVGPMALSGRSVVGSLEKTDNGLVFGAPLDAYLKRKRAQYVEALKQLGHVGPEGTSMTGHTCPVSEKGGGVSVDAAAFSKLANFIHSTHPQ